MGLLEGRHSDYSAVSASIFATMSGQSFSLRIHFSSLATSADDFPRMVLGQRTPGTLQFAYGDMNTNGSIDLSDLILITQAVF